MAEQDVQVGAGTVMGIAGAITMTPATGTAVAAGDANYSSVNDTLNFSMDELANSGGTVIESVIFSKAYKDTKVDFIAKGTTRALAETVFDNVDAWAPGVVITIASATVSTLNKTGNLISGVEKSLTREGRAALSFTIRSYQGTGGTFAGLAAITG
jgi:hypothetical protein